MLCNADGTLNEDAIGWSRSPFETPVVCNLRGNYLRKKQWNCWIISSDRFVLCATISNVDYAAPSFIYLYDRESTTYITKSFLNPAVLGSAVTMPDMVDEDLRLETPRFQIGFVHTAEPWPPVADGETDSNQTQSRFVRAIRCVVRCGDFGGHGLDANMIIYYPPDHETLNVVIPWSKQHFQFTAKHNLLPVRGSVRYGQGLTHTLTANSNAYAALDFGRGVWPFRTSWNWASFSAKCQYDDFKDALDDRNRSATPVSVGVNLGAKWTDGTGMCENAICVDGRLYKISDELDWQYDPNDFMKAWFIRSSVGRRTAALQDTEKTEKIVIVDLQFFPEYLRHDESAFLVLRSVCNQVFGEFRGSIRIGATSIAVEGAFGWAEEFIARW